MHLRVQSSCNMQECKVQYNPPCKGGYLSLYDVCMNQKKEIDMIIPDTPQAVLCTPLYGKNCFDTAPLNQSFNTEKEVIEFFQGNEDAKRRRNQ